MGNARAGWWVGALLLVAAGAQAEEWQTIATGAITVKARARPGTPIREVWAEGDLDAPVYDVQAAVLDAEGYPRFMPYVKETKVLNPRTADGSRLVYTRLDLPFISGRDYVVKVYVDQRAPVDSSGTFKNHWVAAPDAVPPRQNVVRLKVNEGAWEVRPLGPNRSHVVYHFTIDPGGWVPGFAIDMGNRTAATDTFKAVEKEAKKRAEARLAQK